MSNLLVHLLPFLFCLVLLAACQSNPVTNVEEPPPTVPPTGVTPTEEPPTATPPPATATAEPATPTPEFEGELDYTAAVGGPAAGQWDRENVEHYQELYPGVEVDYISANLYGSPVPNGFYIFLNSDNQPDVFSGFVVGNLRTYVEQGAISDISDLWTEMGWHNLFPETVREMMTIDGRQYFVPMAMQWNPIWYRTDIFEEVGLTPPQSWEEFLAACDTLNEAGYIPVAVSSSGWTPPMARWFSILNMRLNGPQFHEALMRGQERYDDERVRNVFQHLSQMFERGCFAEEGTNYQEAAQQLYDGEAAMYNLGEWLSESYDEGLPDTLDFFSFPIMNPDVPRGEIVHVYGAYMTANADHPQEARRFLSYLGSAESQHSNAETLNRLVGHSEVDSELYSDVYSRGLQFIEEADHITTLFEFNTTQTMAGEGLRILGQFWENPEDIDAVVTALERARQQAFE